jgi:uncharacterized protein YeaO (DUF488 family)
MPIHIVRLGFPRSPDEGPRIGTVRRPPRGVPNARFAEDDCRCLPAGVGDLSPTPFLVLPAVSLSSPACR